MFVLAGGAVGTSAGAELDLAAVEVLLELGPLLLGGLPDDLPRNGQGGRTRQTAFRKRRTASPKLAPRPDPGAQALGVERRIQHKAPPRLGRRSVGSSRKVLGRTSPKEGFEVTACHQAEPLAPFV